MKIKILRILLFLGSLFYVIAAVVHFFGLTLFPFYDAHLYTSYHDTVIALVAIILSILLFTVARNPVKNADALSVVIIGGIIAIFFGIGILLKIDFVKLGAPGKKLQTIAEIIMLVIYIPTLYYLKPKD